MFSYILPVVTVLAAGMVTGSPQPPAPRHPPLYLEAEPRGEGIRLRVVGLSESDFEGQFSLEVRSDRATGGNTTSQRGRASLRGGVQHVFVSIVLGQVIDGNWEARLRVEPSDGEPYEVVRRAL